MSEPDVDDKSNKAEPGLSAEKPADDKAVPAQDQGEKASDPKADQKSSANPNEVMEVAGKYEIFPGKPLKSYNVGVNKAYRGKAKDQGASLIVVVCEHYIAPRRMSTDVYKSLLNPNLAKLLYSGPVYWRPDKREKYIFIYADNLGKPLAEEGTSIALGWKQDEVMDVIVQPMVNVLQDIRDKDFFHGGIRPSNMFDGGSSSKQRKIILGDCLSGPPSYHQPLLYEPIHRAMTNPIARGKGTQADDLYAFGVSLSVIMRFNDPMKSLDEDAVIKQKIRLGSYAAVTGKDRFKGEILELLRGLLHDDATQRWTIDEVLIWMDGRRLSPKQSISTKKASRPLSFAGEKYLYMPVLAMDLSQSVSELKKVVEDQSLQQWISRSLEDEDALERIEKAVQDTRQQGIGGGYETRLISNISIALDPNAPLRYKNLRVMGDGIGTAMMEAVATKQSLSPYIEVFGTSMVLNWLALQNNANVDVTGLYNKFEQCRRFLKSNKLGSGIERCVYYLCPEAPCLSDLIKNYYATGPEELLLAYEDLCQRKKAPSSFLDRHAVAFLYQKESKVIEPFMFDLNTQEGHRVLLATLKCFATIQKRYDVTDVPGLTQYFAARIDMVIARYHDRLVRDKLTKSLKEYAGSGNLKKMAGLLDNTEIIQKDFASFRKAMNEYHALEQERQNLDIKLEDKEKFGVRTGREWAAIVSSVIAVVLIVGTAFMFLSDNSPF